MTGTTTNPTENENHGGDDPASFSSRTEYNGRNKAREHHFVCGEDLGKESA
jgi:hypothetical protein